MLKQLYIGYYIIYMTVPLIISTALTPFQVGDKFDSKTQFQSIWSPLLNTSLFLKAAMTVTLGRKHLKTRVKEYLETDKRSQIFVRLVSNTNCEAFITGNYFEIIYSASIPFRLKLKEAMHVMWKKQLLNKQQKLASISKTVKSSFTYFH